MYLLGFSLNNLSLMALTVATGFVVDDAIVVLENTSRHIEAGMTRMQAALLGAKEVGFTVLSISISLVAVFIPLLFMGGQVGRLFREFAVTLSAAVMISLVISLTTTPDDVRLAAQARRRGTRSRRAGSRARRRARLPVGAARLRAQPRLGAGQQVAGDAWCCSRSSALNVYLFAKVPKGFFPQQDSGQLNGGMRADQSISTKEMGAKLRQVVEIVHARTRRSTPWSASPAVRAPAAASCS